MLLVLLTVRICVFSSQYLFRNKTKQRKVGTAGKEESPTTWKGQSPSSPEFPLSPPATQDHSSVRRTNQFPFAA